MDLSNTRIRTPRDITSLPGYRERVDPTREPLNRLLKHYYVSPQLQCSLCGTWHNDGYVVLLDDGGITNIGHDCGEKFGEKFFAEEKAYQEKILRPQLVAKLSDGKRRVEALRQPIAGLVERVRTVLSRRKGLKDRFPRLAAELNRRANQGQPEVFDVVERSAAEIEDLLAINPQQSREALRYREVPRGRIAGLGFYTADAATVVFDELSQKSEAFLEISGVYDLAIERLLEWERWLNNLDERLREGNRIAVDGEAFFTEQNLQLLAVVAQDPKEKALLGMIKPADLEWTHKPSSPAKAPEDESKPLNRRERRRRQFGQS